MSYPILSTYIKPRRQLELTLPPPSHIISLQPLFVDFRVA